MNSIFMEPIQRFVIVWCSCQYVSLVDSNMEKEDPKTRPDISGGSYCSIIYIWLNQDILKAQLFDDGFRQSRHTSGDSGNVQLGLISLSVFGTISFELG